MLVDFNLDRDALFLDVDGTLLDIAPSADQVVVPPSLREDLQALYGRMRGALALVSGRTVENIDRLFSPLCLPCSGGHGTQMRLVPGGATEMASSLPLPLRERLQQAFDGVKGVFLEDKQTSFAIHYRQASLTGAKVRGVVMRHIRGSRQESLALLSGRKVVEVVPTAFSKGRALERFLRESPFGGRRPVFLGDDTTDLSAMESSVRCGGLGLRVSQGDGSDKAAFSSPAKVRGWIHSLAGR